jgi:hypothetical protein
VTDGGYRPISRGSGKWGCVAAAIVGAPVIGLALFGAFADQCGDPGYTDCDPNAPWLLLAAGIGIALAVGLGAAFTITLIRLLMARRQG